jgi:WD40 repeat protein
VDLRTTQTVATLEGVAEHGVGAAISRDNSRVCLSSLQSTVVFELSTGKRICVLEGRPLTMAAAFVGDTHRLVTLGADRTVQMWDGDTCELIARFGQHTAGIRSLDVTADGALIATTGRDGVRIWDTRERRQIARFETSVTAARFNRAGDRLITAGYGGLVKIWNPRAERPVQILRGHTARVMDAQFSRDGRRAVTVSSDATMRLWDVESGALLRARGTSQRLTRGTFGEDNNTLAFVASDVVEIWRLPLENRSPAQLRSRLAELASAGVAR